VIGPDRVERPEQHAVLGSPRQQQHGLDLLGGLPVASERLDEQAIDLRTKIAVRDGAHHEMAPPRLANVPSRTIGKRRELLVVRWQDRRDQGLEILPGRCGPVARFGQRCSQCPPDLRALVVERDVDP
jgi:hypothetical protein